MLLQVDQHAVWTLWSIPAHNPVLKNGNHNRSEVPGGQPILGMFPEQTDRPSRVSVQISSLQALLVDVWQWFFYCFHKKTLNNPLSYHLQAQHWFTLLCCICWKPRKMYHPSGPLTRSLSEHCLKAGCLHDKAQSTAWVVSIRGNLTYVAAGSASSCFYWSREEDLHSSPSLRLPWGQLRERL